MYRRQIEDIWLQAMEPRTRNPRANRLKKKMAKASIIFIITVFIIPFVTMWIVG